MVLIRIHSDFVSQKNHYKFRMQKSHYVLHAKL